LLAAALALGAWTIVAPDAAPARQRNPRIETSSAAWTALTFPRSIAENFQRAADLRSFVELHRDGLANPETAYYVSQALEECAALRVFYEDRDARWVEVAATAALTAPCRGFDDRIIEPREIVALLSLAALGNEPHAIARMLLFRDIAASKDDVIDELPGLLATRDPVVVRDVGAFLSKGEAVWRFGGEEVAAGTAAVAWELAACDLGYACGPASRIVLAQCAFEGRCEAGGYEDALMRYEHPDVMAEAQRLRPGILRALREHDWRWLGLGPDAGLSALPRSG
jgi:hypothetical protein